MKGNIEASMLNKCPPLVSRRLLEAQNFDGHDRDGLIAEYAFVGLKLAGYIGMLNHLRQPKVLDPSRR